jgi:EmrB/QacA subfamily drug resistance transporter
MSIAFGSRYPCDNAACVDARRHVSCPERDKPWVLGVSILGSSLAFIEGSVVGVALPSMQSSFSIDSASVQWVANAYLLILGAFLLIGGAAGDRFGLRRVFIAGTALFGLGALACGIVNSLSVLIAARVVQGLGAAALVPTSLALISRYFDKAERGRAIGIWAGASALTTAMGPALGGWLVDAFEWPAVFLIVPPIALLAVLLAVWRVPVDVTRTPGPLDYVGAALLAGALVSLVLAILQIDMFPPLYWWMLSFVLGIAFLLRQYKARTPMLPLTLFRIPAFSGVNLMTLLLYGALSGILYFLPFNLIQVQGYSALQTGAAFLPMTFLIGIGSIFAGALTQRFSERQVLTVGPLIAGLGFAACALPGTDTHYMTDWLPAVVLIGIGMTLCVAPLTTVVMNAVDDDRAGLASGVNNTAARLAGVLAIALLTAVAVSAFSSSLEGRLQDAAAHDDVREQLLAQSAMLADLDVPADMEDAAGIGVMIDQSYVDAFRQIALACAVAAFLSAGISWLTLRPKRARSSR